MTYLKKRKFSVIILIFLSCCHFCLAQDSIPSGFRVRGVIADSVTHQPLAFITISLSDEAKKIVKTLATKDDGEFYFSNLSNRQYTLTANAIGYRSIKILINPGTTISPQVDLNVIYLNRQSIDLKEVAVVASQPLITQKLDRISYNLKSDPDSKSSSVLDMMKKVPYLSVDAGDNILLKGDAGYRILINGKPSGLVEKNAKNMLRSMPASSIQSIEVITTPSSKEESEGVAGIINIITNKKPSDGYEGAVNVNQTGPVGGTSGGGSLSYKTGKLGITAFGGLNRYNTPETRLTTQRKTDNFLRSSSLLQDGTEKSDNTTGYLGTEVSYEVDSLHRLSGQFNFNKSSLNNSALYQTTILDNLESTEQFSLARTLESKSTSIDAGIDYEIGFKNNKKRLLSFSYRYSNYFNDYNNSVGVFDTLNTTQRPYQQVNNENAAENTFQADYIFPVRKVLVETGVKAIWRSNGSEFQTLNDFPDGASQFDNTQRVYAAYNTYQFELYGMEVKGGYRLEETTINANFVPGESRFSKKYLNMLPSLVIGRKIGKAGSLNLGFSQRIKRPGINQLNPFVDRSNPSFEFRGNPDLRPSVLNGIQLGYGYSGKIKMNMGLGYAFFDGLAIPLSYYDLDRKITVSTYQNAGSGKGISSSISLTYPLSGNVSLGLNSNLNYIWIKTLSNNIMISDQGFMFNLAANAQYKIGNGWRLSTNLNYVNPRINYQRRSNAVLSSNLTINKTVLSDKLTIYATISNPFTKNRDDIMTTYGVDFNQTTIREIFFRNYKIGLSYNFGKLKQGIRKNKVSIKNDDVSTDKETRL